MAGAAAYQPGEGRALDFGPHRGVLKTAEGANIVPTEVTMVPGGDPPLHMHKTIHECVYVLEGEVEFVDESRTYPGKAGSVVTIPPGAVHGLRVVGTKPARVLTVCTPAEPAITMLEAMAEAMSAADDPQKMMEILSKADMQIVG